MTDTDKWIKATYDDLESKIKDQENEFIDLFNEYLSEFFIDDTTIKSTSGNFDKVNEINKKFDEAYVAILTPFLIWYGKKLLEAGKISLDYFKSIGVKASADDISYLGKMIGIDGNKIVKGSFLWNLGMMGEVRQRIQQTVINAVSSGQKFNILARNIKPVFKSTQTTKSTLAKYYLKYAYNPIMQTLNSVSYTLAKQYGITEFIYSGGLVEKSRQFCIDRNGNRYSIGEAKKWNDLEWDGKIKGVDFFVQCGGHFCKHFLEWTDKDTNG